jgi:DNA-binding beta-propeller fold protein YncE
LRSLIFGFAGNLIEQRMEAEPNLLYSYGWDKRNVYRQKVYGVASAVISVGYEYVNCDQVIWDVRQIALPAADLPMAELGGLSIDVQHRYNPAGGVLQRGDGERHYLAADAQLQIETLLGDGVQRPLHCTFCNGPLQSIDSNGSPQQSYGRLLAPVAMASAPDGSVYLADYNLIRRIDLAAGRVSTVVELNSSQVAYKYHLAVSPVDGKLYVSDPERYQVFVVRQLNPLDSDEQQIDPRENLELFAGNGIKCLPGDKSHCGDRRPARQARLAYPKALAVNSLNEVFIADGTNIRYIDTTGVIHTLLGDHHVRSHWRPFPCNGPSPSAMKVSLRWPTEIAFHPLDGSLHLLDDQMVLRLTSDRRLQIVAGRPTHCAKSDQEEQWIQPNSIAMVPTINSTTDNQAVSSPYLETPQAIAFTPDGKLLIAESDSQHVNRVRVWNTQTQKPSVSLFAGSVVSSCSCLELGCECFDHELGLAKNAKMSTVSALAITPAGHVLIADQGNLRIRLVRARSLPRPVNSHGDFELHWPPANEIYLFNRYGQHLQTVSVLDRRPLYSFVYSANSSVAKLSAVIERGSGRRLHLLRDHQHQIKAIESSAAPSAKLSMSVNKQRLLSDLRYADGRNVQLQYARGNGLVVRLSDQPPAQAVRQLHFQYDSFGRLLSKSEQ